ADTTLFRLPVDMTLSAFAQDVEPNGSVVSVEFFDGSSSLGFGVRSDNDPNVYTLPWRPTTTGQYLIRVVATDDRNAKGSDSRSVEVIDAPLAVTPDFPPDPQFEPLPDPVLGSERIGTTDGAFRVNESGQSTF